MNPRRVILGVIIFGGLLLLMLGFAGVFSADRPLPSPPPPARPEVRSDTGPAARQEYALENLTYKGANWELTAPEGRLDPERGVRLTKPVATLTRSTARGEQRVHATAETGVYTSEPEQRIEMSGDVRVELKGENNLLLLTEFLEGSPNAGIARTYADVKLIVETKEGQQVLSGRGAEVSLKERTARVDENIRMELSGGDRQLPVLGFHLEYPSSLLLFLPRGSIRPYCRQGRF